MCSQQYWLAVFHDVSLALFALLSVEMSGCEPHQEPVLSFRTKGKTQFLYWGVVTAGVSCLLQRQEQLAGVGGEVGELGVPLKSLVPDPMAEDSQDPEETPL